MVSRMATKASVWRRWGAFAIVDLGEPRQARNYGMSYFRHRLPEHKYPSFIYINLGDLERILNYDCTQSTFI